jgi:uncharacterized membrane protein YdjX (TVP38/TMEM64 family)
MNKHLALRISFLSLLVVLLVYIVIHFDLYLMFTDMNRLMLVINKYHPYDEFAFILLQILQVVAAPIPGELSGFIGGYLYGPIWGTIYSTIGLTLGSWLAFMLARFFGEPLLERVIKKEVFEKFECFMEHKGLLVSFLLFLIPGFPKDYLCYIMGMSRIPALTFIIISTVGRIFGTLMLSISGNMAHNRQYVLLAIVAAAGIAVFAFALYNHERLLLILKNKPNKADNCKSDR